MIFKKSFLVLVGFCLFVFIITGCGRTDESNNSEEINGDDENKEVLQMVTTASFPPFEFTETEGGEEEFKGIDIDIAKHITEQLDVDLEISDIDFSSIIGSLQQNRADFSITGMSSNPEREKNVDFTDPYFVPKEAIIWRKGDSTEYSDVDDLKGKEVATSIGSLQEDKMKDADGVSVKSMDGNSPVAEEVLAGRVDAGFMISTQAESFLETNPELEMEVVPRDSDDEIGFAIVLPKDSEWKDKFDEELDNMKEDGSLDEILSDWLDSEHIE